MNKQPRNPSNPGRVRAGVLRVLQQTPGTWFTAAALCAELTPAERPVGLLNAQLPSIQIHLATTGSPWRLRNRPAQNGHHNQKEWALVLKKDLTTL